MNIDQPSVIIDDEPLLERADRPRSRTWPILPPPIETIHEHERDAEIAEPPPIIEEVEPEEEPSETQKAETNPRKNSRKNAWGNLSYADLITQAIQSSPEQRLTLAQIYEWMVRNIPYFKDKGDSTSSAGWKNSIRHNLSLHSRFMRVQNDNNGKSSYWVINPDAKPGKSSRRRSGSVDGQPKGDKKRLRTKKMHQSTDDISALSPNALKLKHNRSYENLFAGSPCSSTDSLSNVDDYHTNELPYPYNAESFARPRSTSNVSTQSSVNGRTTPPHVDIDDAISFDDNQIVASGVADEIQSMSIDNHCTMGNTINLNDSVKYNGATDNTLTRPHGRPHADSIGSIDSGYESPAFQSPIQQNQVGNMQNRPMSKLPSPNLLPNKPPPPYGTFHNPMRQQQQPTLFNVNYFQQPQQTTMGQQQLRTSMMVNHAPRLKHLPLANQNPFTPQKPNMSTYNPGLPSNRSFPGAMQNGGHQNNLFDNYMSNGNIVPNITVDNKMVLFQQQLKMQNMYVNNEIPMDLSQVPLFDLGDPQLVANDIDAIINGEMKESFKNDSNNNNNKRNVFNQQNLFPGPHWVR